ncbi:MAG TPA: serine/threonine-protein kinase [Bryobacteraceae bacterium]|jgi:serine/threonine-protein kinase
MDRCVTCNSELADSSSKTCPSCGPLAALANGTLATVAMDAVASAAAAATPHPSTNGSKASSTGRTSLPRLSDTSIPDDGRFLPGTLVNGRYRIVGLLGRGGMGEVYRATDLTLAQPVALKFLPEAGVTERVLERFHAEVRIARQVSHPNICRVYDIGEVDGQPFISMEYVDGEDLAGLLQRIGRLPADKALETSRKICAGLAAAHDKGVIHRDLKPQNIMLNKRGEPVIMDFGLAAVASQLTGAEARNGTPAYMAPEQLRGEEVTAKSDIYSLGLVLYEIFSGKRAYEAKTLADLLKLQESAHAPSLTSLAADVDPQVEKVVKRCLNPDPAQRPATPLAVAAALPGGDPLAAALAAGETPSPEMVAASGKTEGMDLRYSIPLLVFVLAVVIGYPFWYASNTSLNLVPVNYSPAIAAHEARKIAASFGYTQPPRDWQITSRYVGSADYWSKHDRKGKSWTELIAAEPPRSYAYRESPALLEAPPFARVTQRNPAPITAGMIRMEVSIDGHLRQFEAIPAETAAPGSTPGAPLDETALFKSIGYDRTQFTETDPQRVPMVMADLRKAWKGPAPGLPGVEARVEAGSLAGKITSVKVVLPWTQPDRVPEPPPSGASWIFSLSKDSLYALGFLFSLLFAIRNLNLRRADTKGALRVATVRTLLVFTAWIGTAHHTASNAEWNALVYQTAITIFDALLLWILYIALEPTIRSRWPHVLVTWNRLLAGRFGDAQVGAHILIGASIGACVTLGFAVLEMVTTPPGTLPWGSDLESSLGTMLWIGGKANELQNAMFYGFIVFFAVFFFRMLLRNDYLAAFVAAIVFAMINDRSAWTGPHAVLIISFYIGVYTVLTWLLLRLGLVANIAAIFVLNTLLKICVDSHFSAWYTPFGVASMAVLLSLTLYAFWRSIGSRTLTVDAEAA